MFIWLFSVVSQTSVAEERPTKSAGKTEEQEKAEELPWKLPVIVGGSIAVVLSKQMTVENF